MVVFFYPFGLFLYPSQGFSFMSNRHPVAQNPLTFCILKNKYLYNHYCRLKHGIIFNNRLNNAQSHSLSGSLYLYMHGPVDTIYESHGIGT